MVAAPPNDSVGIEVRELSKRLRGKEVLGSVNLVVPRGTVCAIEGRNGAGKTTLVRILATVMSPDSGTARINGYDTESHGLAVRRSIGVSFANERSLYWRLNAYQNLQFFGRIAGMPKASVAARSTLLLEELNLTAVADGQVARMSTGQRQRLMLARALLTEPVVTLLDEPFRGLDDDGIHLLKRVIARLKESGNTVLVVAPMIRGLDWVADSMHRLEGGVIRTIDKSESDGSASELS